MIYKAFSIHDAKAETFSPPFFQAHVGLAMRTFQDLVHDPQMPMGKHPEDFSLYEIGLLDDGSALLTPLTPIKLLSMATDFKKEN